jgi:hypothetical protein
MGERDLNVLVAIRQGSSSLSRSVVRGARTLKSTPWACSPSQWNGIETIVGRTQGPHIEALSASPPGRRGRRPRARGPSHFFIGANLTIASSSQSAVPARFIDGWEGCYRQQPASGYRPSFRVARDPPEASQIRTSGPHVINATPISRTRRD